MTNEERSLLLRFATTVTRLPILKANTFTMRIGRIPGPTDQRLMKAQTCSNYLMIPPYADFERARRLILAAVKFTATIENA
jgi:hypothetical protein